VYSPADEGSKAISNGELPPVGQSGDDSKDLESRKSRVVIESPSGRQPVIKSKSITITVGKSRGQRFTADLCSVGGGILQQYSLVYCIPGLKRSGIQEQITATQVCTQ